MNPSEIKSFCDWLTARGAQVLEPTNPYELVRFETSRGIGIVYTNAKGKRTLVGEASAAHRAFKASESWNAGTGTKRKSGKSDRIIAQLRRRDGDCCFFCRAPVGADASVEHLVALGHGGPNHFSNYALAHQACNVLGGHLSVMEKLAIRESAARPVLGVVSAIAEVGQ